MSTWVRFACALGLWLGAVACDDASGGGGPDPGQQGPTPDATARDVDAAVLDEDAARQDADAAPHEPDAWAPDAAAPDAGPPADAGPLVDAAQPPPEIRALETRLGTPSTVAGLANRVTCEALDADGVPVAGISTRWEVRPASGWRLDEDAEGSIVGTVAGTYSIVCVADGLGLRDGTPARWDVLAGPAAAVYARVEPTLVAAGGAVGVDCEAADAEGNPVDAAAAAVQVLPAGAGAAVAGRDVTFTTAGRYRVDCALPGAISEGSATVTVVPGPPAALVAALVPERPVYSPGEVVGFRPTVTDAWGNAIDGATLEWEARPPLPGFGEGRFRPAVEGRYTLHVRVTGETFEARALEAHADILVDAGGPAVGCTSPEPGAMVGMGAVRLEGQVSDVAGVRAVRVDGAEVPVGPDGRFAAEVRPRWGLNVHDLVAVDAVGNENSTFCSYFASDRYHPEGEPLGDAILLHLTSRAIDDGPPDRPLRSLTDLLRAVVNSPALVAQIDQSLRAQNPIVPRECRQRVLGVCILSLGAEYRGMRIGGPNEMSISLSDQGLRLRARINRLALDVDLQGTISNDGTIEADYVLADLTFGISLENGRPRVRRVATNAVEVGEMDSDFDGFLTGDLLDLVFWAFEGTIRDTVTDAMRDFLEGEVDALLADVLAGLDVSSLGTEIDVPAPGGGPDITLGVGVGFSTMHVNAQRMLLGMATTIQGPVNEGAPSAGVPEPPGERRLAMQPQGTVGGAVSVTMLNQILHRLWRAGLFRFDDAGGLLGGDGGGAGIALRFQTPPAAEGIEGGVRLYLGPAVGTMSLPELFAEPLRVRLAVQAAVQVALVDGSSIQFGDGQGGGIAIERLYLAFDGASVTDEARAALEARMVGIVQALIDGSLNDALPVLPIPDFELPESLAEYGIRAGTRLGLRGPRLTTIRSHWVLDGEFRE